MSLVVSRDYERHYAISSIIREINSLFLFIVSIMYLSILSMCIISSNIFF